MKVFLSSTAVDLVAYRQVADDTILRLSQQALVMERFGPLPGTVGPMGGAGRDQVERGVQCSRPFRAFRISVIGLGGPRRLDIRAPARRNKNDAQQ